MEAKVCDGDKRLDPDTGNCEEGPPCDYLDADRNCKTNPAPDDLECTDGSRPVVKLTLDNKERVNQEAAAKKKVVQLAADATTTTSFEEDLDALQEYTTQTVQEFIDGQDSSFTCLELNGPNVWCRGRVQMDWSTKLQPRKMES